MNNLNRALLVLLLAGCFTSYSFVESSSKTPPHQNSVDVTKEKTKLKLIKDNIKKLKYKISMIKNELKKQKKEFVDEEYVDTKAGKSIFWGLEKIAKMKIKAINKKIETADEKAEDLESEIEDKKEDYKDMLDDMGDEEAAKYLLSLTMKETTQPMEKSAQPMKEISQTMKEAAPQSMKETPQNSSSSNTDN